MVKKTQAPRKGLMATMVEQFVSDMDDEIGEAVRRLSVAEYGEWLTEFRAQICAIVDARLEAQKEDLG